MPNLLPPRPVGAMAATKACLDADVIFVAPDLETSPASRHLAELPDRPGDPRQVRAGAFDLVPREASHKASSSGSITG